MIFTNVIITWNGDLQAHRYSNLSQAEHKMCEEISLASGTKQLASRGKHKADLA